MFILLFFYSMLNKGEVFLNVLIILSARQRSFTEG
jgi:hypothetical protein